MSGANIGSSPDEVTSSSVIADNAVVRGDGGTNAVQGSSVLIDDSDNITGVAALTASGAVTAASASLSTPLPVLSGGTAASSATAAFGGLAPTTTKGDVIAYNGSTNARVAVGTNDQVLTADSTQASGVKWADGGGGGGTNFPGNGIAAGTFYSIPTTLTSTTNLGIVDSRLYMCPFFVTEETTLTTVAITVSAAVAGSQARVGLYSLTPSSGLFTLVTDWGNLSTAATGTPTASVSDTLTAGTHYFYGIVVDENSGAVSLSASANTQPLAWNSAGFALARSMYINSIDAGVDLPATVAFGDLTAGGTGAIPLLVYR